MNTKDTRFLTIKKFIIPLIAGISVFILYLLFGKYYFLQKQKEMISNLMINGTNVSNPIKFSDLSGDIKVVTFFHFFNADCQNYRIKELEKLDKTKKMYSKYITIQNIAIFCGDYKINDLKNFKKMLNININCAVPYGDSNDEIRSVGIKKSPYSIIVDKWDKLIFYERYKKSTEFSKRLVEILSKYNK